MGPPTAGPSLITFSCMMMMILYMCNDTCNGYCEVMQVLPSITQEDIHVYHVRAFNIAHMRMQNRSFAGCCVEAAISPPPPPPPPPPPLPQTIQKVGVLVTSIGYSTGMTMFL